MDIFHQITQSGSPVSLDKHFDKHRPVFYLSATECSTNVFVPVRAYTVAYYFPNCQSCYV